MVLIIIVMRLTMLNALTATASANAPSTSTGSDSSVVCTSSITRNGRALVHKVGSGSAGAVLSGRAARAPRQSRAIRPRPRQQQMAYDPA